MDPNEKAAEDLRGVVMAAIHRFCAHQDLAGTELALGIIESCSDKAAEMQGGKEKGLGIPLTLSAIGKACGHSAIALANSAGFPNISQAAAVDCVLAIVAEAARDEVIQYAEKAQKLKGKG